LHGRESRARSSSPPGFASLTPVQFPFAPLGWNTLPYCEIRDSVESYVRKQASRDFAGFEVFFGDRPRGLTVPAVVAVDRIDRGDGRVAGREPKEPFTCRENVAEPRVLGDYGLSACQIVGVAFAEPAAAQ